MGVITGIGITSIVESNLTFSLFSPNDSYTNIVLRGMEIPVSLYFKIAGIRREWGFYVGGGATYTIATAGVERKLPSGTSQGDLGVKKWIPHGLAGLEIFLSRHLAIDANVRYLFSGILEDFRAEVKDSHGTSLGDGRIIMVKDPPYGEFLDLALVSEGLDNNDRLFKQDFGGPRFNVSLKFYFGK